MGLFKSLKKLGSKLVGGVKKVFKKVGEGIGKVMNSGIGKILMIALTVVTLGTALIAGFAAFSAGMAAGTGFVSSMISGGSAFIGSLTGMSAAKEGATAGASSGFGAGGALADAASANAAVGGAAGAGAGATAGTIGAMSGIPAVPELAAIAAPAVAPAAAAVAAPTMGAKVMGGIKAVGSFAKDNPGLLNIAGKMASGYAEGKTIEEMDDRRREDDDRVNRLWADYDIEALQKNVKPSNVVPIHSGSFKAFKDKATTGTITQQEKAKIRDAGQGRVRLDRESALETGGR
jgi:hypothetical protein